MEIRGSTLALIVAAGGAAVYAAYNAGGASASPKPAAATPAPPMQQGEDMEQQELPPNHPPIDQGSMTGMNAAPSDDAPAIRWTPPAAWHVAPNPNAMRVATYQVAAAKGDAEGAEVIVARAGGSTDANVQRWVGQFGAEAKSATTKEKVAGFDVTLVDISGTYSGGMSMNDTTPKADAGWAMRAAIVETPGTSYFFKMIGPAATVASARAAFDGMIHGIQAVQ